MAFLSKSQTEYQITLRKTLVAGLQFLLEVARGRFPHRKTIPDRLKRTGLHLSASFETYVTSVVSSAGDFVLDKMKEKESKKPALLESLLTLPLRQLELMVDRVAREAACRWDITINAYLEEKAIQEFAAIGATRVVEYLRRKALSITTENLLFGLIAGHSGAGYLTFLPIKASMHGTIQETTLSAEQIYGRAGYLVGVNFYIPKILLDNEGYQAWRLMLSPLANQEQDGSEFVADQNSKSMQDLKRVRTTRFITEKEAHEYLKYVSNLNAIVPSLNEYFKALIFFRGSLKGTAANPLNLSKANFSGSDFSGCTLEHCILGNCQGLYLTEATLHHVSATGDQLDHAHLDMATVTDCQFTKLTGLQTDWSFATIERSDFKEGVGHGMILDHAMMDEATKKTFGYLSNAVTASVRKQEEEQKTLAEKIALAKTLGYVPLAMTQAIAYIKHHALSISEYLQLYRDNEHLMLQDKTVPPDADHLAVAVTLNISLSAMKATVKRDNKALFPRTLLNACAYLAPANIPFDLLFNWLKEACPTLEEPASCLHASLSQLKKYALIREDPMTKTLTVHRLVQTIMRHQQQALKTNRPYATLLKAIHAECIRKTQDLEDEAIHAECIRKTPVLEDEARQRLLLPHCQSLVEHYYALWPKQESAALAAVLADIGHIFLYRFFNPLAAQPYYKRALSIQERLYGKENIKIASTLEDLGNVYRDLEDAIQAKEMYERALIIKERYYGKEHVLVARTLVNLGSAYYLLGDAKQPKELYERALIIFERYFPQELLMIGGTLFNLTCANVQLGNKKEAYELAQRAYYILLRCYGVEHKKTKAVGNLVKDLSKDALLFSNNLQSSYSAPFVQNSDPSEDAPLLFSNNLQSSYSAPFVQNGDPSEQNGQEIAQQSNKVRVIQKNFILKPFFIQKY